MAVLGSNTLNHSADLALQRAGSTKLTLTSTGVTVTGVLLGTSNAPQSSAAAVGSYQLCRNSSGATVNADATVAGSSLKPSYGIDGGGWIGVEPSPAGTWRNMSSANLASNRHGLFQRIS